MADESSSNYATQLAEAERGPSLSVSRSYATVAVRAHAEKRAAEETFNTKSHRTSPAPPAASRGQNASNCVSCKHPDTVTEPAALPAALPAS